LTPEQMAQVLQFFSGLANQPSNPMTQTPGPTPDRNEALDAACRYADDAAKCIRDGQTNNAAICAELASAYASIASLLPVVVEG